MTGYELERILSELGWSHWELAFRLKINRITVGRLIRGGDKAIPEYIAAYVDVADKINRSWVQWVKPKAPPLRPGSKAQRVNELQDALRGEDEESEE